MTEIAGEKKLRRYIAEIAKKGAAIKNCGRMCDSCAFKKDSPANLEPWTVVDAAYSLDGPHPFNCHVKPGVDAGTRCIGYLHAMQFLNQTQSK